MSLLTLPQEPASPNKNAKSDKKVKLAPDDDTDPAVREALRSGEWKEVKDPKGKTYYYNRMTKKTTWDLKKELQKQATSAAVPGEVSTPPTAAAGGGARAVDDTKPVDPARGAPASPGPVDPPTTAQRTTGADIGGRAHVSPSSSKTEETPPPHSEPSSSRAAAADARSFAASFAPPYVDPVERLLKHNDELRRVLAGGSRGQLALDFQQRYDALERTNQALGVQLERLKREHESMITALTEATQKIHEQQALIARFQPNAERDRADELQLTLSHLREQNRVLTTHCAELSVLLARGLNETAARAADHYATSESANDAAGVRLISRFLDSGVRHALCPNCVLSVTRYRDRLLGQAETNVGRRVSMGRSRSPSSTAHFDPFAAVGGEAAPVYRPVPEITSPPGTQYYSEPQPFKPPPVDASSGGYTYGVPPSANTVALRNGPKEQASPVLFGGFVVRGGQASVR